MAVQMTNFQIFLSYSTIDSEAFAQRLSRQLEQAKFSVWVDRENIIDQNPWSEAIEEALQNCAVLVVIVPSAIMESEYLKREVELARKYRKPIAIVTHNTSTIPPYLAYEPRFDFQDSFADSLSQFVAFLKWATGEQWKRLERSLGKAVSDTELNQVAAKTTSELGAILVKQLMFLEWTVADLAKVIDVDIDFLQGILDGDFPLDELDEEFLTELAEATGADLASILLLRRDTAPESHSSSALMSEFCDSGEIYAKELLLQLVRALGANTSKTGPLKLSLHDEILALRENRGKAALGMHYLRDLLGTGCSRKSNVETEKRQGFETYAAHILKFKRSTHYITQLSSTECWPLITKLCLISPDAATDCLWDYRSKVPDTVLYPLRSSLLSQLSNPRIRPNTKAAIGRLLGQLNWDDRPGVGIIDGIPDIEWCGIELPVSPINQDLNAHYHPTKSNPVVVRIAKYLVTYKQYEAFVDDGGYSNHRFWSLEGIKWKGERLQPEFYWKDPNYHIDNYPVVGVTWYETLAFCRWLTSKLGLKDGQIRLPTEQEWEWAALKGSEHIWGNPFETRQETTSCTGSVVLPVANTTAVGLSGAGNDDDVMTRFDMTGNVWEWCLSVSAKPSKRTGIKPVLRRFETGRQIFDRTLAADCTQPTLTGFRLCLTDSGNTRAAHPLLEGI
jgi:hypothetical protein